MYDIESIVDQILESIELEDALEIHGAQRKEAREKAKLESEIVKELVKRGKEANISERRMMRLIGSSRSSVRIWLGKESDD